MTGDQVARTPVSAEARGRARELLRTLDADYRRACCTAHQLLNRVHQSGGGRLPKGEAESMTRNWFEATAGPSRVFALDHLRRNAGTGRCATDIRLCAQSFTVGLSDDAEFDEEGFEVRGWRLEYGRRHRAVRPLRPCVLFGLHAVARLMMRGPRLADAETLCTDAALLVRWYAPLLAAHDQRSAPGVPRPPSGKEITTLPAAHGEGAWIGRLATLGIEGGLLPILWVRTFYDDSRLSFSQRDAVVAVAAVDHECREELEEAAAHCLAGESGRLTHDAITAAAGATYKRRA